LDQEQHEMNETCETANAAMYPAIPRLAGDIAPFDYAQGRLRQGGRFHAFSQKICTECKFFVKKLDHVPRCHRRIGPFIQADAWSGTDHVTPVMNRTDAVGVWTTKPAKLPVLIPICRQTCKKPSQATQRMQQ
jgi:hypothetical protein